MHVCERVGRIRWVRVSPLIAIPADEEGNVGGGLPRYDDGTTPK